VDVSVGVRQFLSRGLILLLALAALAMTATAVLFASWMADRARLRTTAQTIASRSTGPQDLLADMTAWVYANQGFAKNRNYFIWKALDATPIHVLESGGDCEDKSKLLATMLREVGVSSTLAMLYDCRGDCRPVHTVVLAETDNGWTPLDAVYNITFPGPEGRLLPVEALRADPSILNARLDQLMRLRGSEDKIARYKRKLETYSDVTTVNWNKNGATKAVASLIEANGGEPELTPRPLFLDDPKQFFVVAGLCLVIGFAFLAMLFSLLVDRGSRSVAARRGPAPAHVWAARPLRR